MDAATLPAPSSNCTLAVWCVVVDALSATGAFSSDDNLEFQGNFDASTSAPPVALAPAKVGQILPVLVRRLGTCAVTARRGRGSEEFGPLETIPLQRRAHHRSVQAALKDAGLQPSDIALRPIELPNCSLHASLPECCASAAPQTRLHGLRWFFSREGGRAKFARES